MQCDAIRQMARVAERNAEIAKHKSPQIKRSMVFLLNVKFQVEDAKESLEKAVSEEGDINTALYSLETKLDSLESRKQTLIFWQTELPARLRLDGKLLKCFESDLLFKGADAKALTNKFKAAENQATKDSFRGRRD